MKKLLDRIRKRLRLPGRSALASLALLGMLSSSGAFAMSAPTSGGASGAAPSSGSKVTAGAGEVIEEWENLFGWRVGAVTITAPFQCIDCTCQFTGKSLLTETLAIMACEVTNEVVVAISCPGSGSGVCPSGGMGQMKVVSYECCVAVNGFPLCVSSTVTTTACP